MRWEHPTSKMRRGGGGARPRIHGKEAAALGFELWVLRLGIYTSDLFSKLEVGPGPSVAP